MQTMIFCFTGIGGGIIELCHIVEIQQTFKEYRGFAQACCTAASSLGNLLGSPLTALMLRSYGWHGTLLLHSAIILNLVWTSLLFRDSKTRAKMLGVLPSSTVKQPVVIVKDTADPPTSTEEQPMVIAKDVVPQSSTETQPIICLKNIDSLQSTRKQKVLFAKNLCDFKAFTDISFVLFTLSLVCFRASSFAISFHLFGRALDVGMEESTAIWLLSGYAFGSLSGRIIVALISDRPGIRSNRVILSGGQTIMLTIVSCSIPFVEAFPPSLILSILVGVFHGKNLHNHRAFNY